MVPHIRDVTRDVVGAVRSLLVETWHANYDALLGRDRVTEITGVWHAVPNLAAQVGRPQAAFLLAEADGRVVATSEASLGEDGTLMLGRLYVLPSDQGRGIGRMLLERTLARFPGAARVRLEVEPGNERAIRFYERCGFERLAETAACGGRADIPAALMEKTLNRLRQRS